jgi:hypothetical protein
MVVFDIFIDDSAAENGAENGDNQWSTGRRRVKRSFFQGVQNRSD